MGSRDWIDGHEYTDNGTDFCLVLATYDAPDGRQLVVRWTNCDRGHEGGEIVPADAFAVYFRRARADYNFDPPRADLVCPTCGILTYSRHQCAAGHLLARA